MFKKNLPSIILYTGDNEAHYSKVFKEAVEALNGEILFVRNGNSNQIQKRLRQFSYIEED